MNANDFRRIALSLPGAKESSHKGVWSPDFRVGGRTFATLASQNKGYGKSDAGPEQQSAFVEELPCIFLPAADGWGRGGATHVRLARSANTSWKARCGRHGSCESKRMPSPATGPPNQFARGRQGAHGAKPRNKKH
jgi:hypothetical protein